MADGRKHTRHSRVIIDLDSIRHNYRYLKQTASGQRVIAVVKADAYGHGAVAVAQALTEADAFGVATVPEAVQLRQAGIQPPIIVMGGVVDHAEILECIEYDLSPVIHQHWQLDLLRETSAAVDIWVKFNSGMGRLGFAPEELGAVLDALKSAKYPGRVRLMTHLANADNTNDTKSDSQLAAVRELALENYEWGIANSAGILGWPASHRLWVRAGIALYGSDPLQSQEHAGNLRPAMRFESQVLAVYQRRKGETIGYGSLYTCQQDETIAVVAAGYADGYPRHVEGGYVTINGARADIVGRVSMDMITIRVSGIDVKPGDAVLLWGDNPCATEIASLSETIPYELYCHAGCHGQREYLNK